MWCFPVAAGPRLSSGARVLAKLGAGDLGAKHHRSLTPDRLLFRHLTVSLIPGITCGATRGKCPAAPGKTASLCTCGSGTPVILPVSLGRHSTWPQGLRAQALYRHTELFSSSSPCPGASVTLMRGESLPFERRRWRGSGKPAFHYAVSGDLCRDVCCEGPAQPACPE